MFRCYKATVFRPFFYSLVGLCLVRAIQASTFPRSREVVGYNIYTFYQVYVFYLNIKQLIVNYYFNRMGIPEKSS